ncbi:hypothetical protein FOG18_12805 [Legionella israelensis]|uniref:bacteriophage holin n=1 Tax=Legionella israelensis TaxID=454 RepID=UPI001180E1DF|nr:bacteriophage holin [Legionella israelensis]QDP73381.1 hypothetical protein FOG18_12805 [Legionella israelensis]
MKNYCKLSPLALGLSLGVFWGVSLLIMGLLAYFLSYGVEFVTAINALYMVYEPSILGSIIGAIIGFIDAFICGVIIAWLYNCFGRCHACHGKKAE